LSAGDLPQIPLGKLKVLPRPPSSIKGSLLLRKGKGRRGDGKRGDGREVSNFFIEVDVTTCIVTAAAFK